MYIKLSEIPNFAKKIAASAKGGEIYALIGELGSGKTTFTKALGKALKIKHHITSPTFVLMNRYPFKKNGQWLHLYHLDLYRIKNFKDAKALGLTEIWQQKNSFVVIEWADKISRYLPGKTKKLFFKN